MNTITWNDFEKVDLRVGTIVDVEDFPAARKPAYILHVDFGDELGVRKSSAQITALYDKKALVGKQIIGVVNFPPKQIGPIMSACLVTGLPDADGHIVLAVPDKPLPDGAKLC